MITIATNMAGRGTDIVLGGNVEKQAALIEADQSLLPMQKERLIQQLNDEWQDLHERVKAAGGLHIIGTERHESRRIDNQLRGRAGRQGDQGSSRFYLSLDDALLRIFAGDRVRAIMDRLKMPEGEAIEAGIVTRSIESAQRKVEGRNFDTRKQLLQYDDVANEQRKEIYRLRNEILESADIGEMITNLRQSVLLEQFRLHVPEGSMEEQWELATLEHLLKEEWALDLPLLETVEKAQTIEDQQLLEQITQAAEQAYEAKVAVVGRQSFAAFERSIMLQSLDSHWREHLAALDHLRQGIHLRGYAQKDPKQEYKREAFALFSELLDTVKREVTRILMTVRLQSVADIEEAAEAMGEPLALENIAYSHQDQPTADENFPTMSANASFPKVGRNDPCPCQSGKKYKHCHGKLA